MVQTRRYYTIVETNERHPETGIRLMTTATMSHDETPAPVNAIWTACPTCTGHGLKADVAFDAPTGERFCPTCEGLGNVRKN